MKKLYFLSVLILTVPFFVNAQQRVTSENALRLIEEKLLRDKPNASRVSNPAPFEGMVRQGLSAPTGIFIENVSPDELRRQSTFFGGDSLNGFVFEKVAKDLTKNNEIRLLNEFKAAMRHQQIAFIKNKYNIADPPQPATLPPGITAKTAPNSISASICNNIDFEDGNLNTWTVTSGYNTNSNATLTIPASAFTVGVVTTDQNIYSCSDVNIITSAYGNDPIGFPGLDPNGATTSIRLGGFNINAADGYGFGCTGSHWTTGSYANGEKCEKIVLVNASNALLTYDYAVVLNDGGHANGQQPYFHVLVTDMSGNVLSSCTQYYVQATAGGPPAGFINSGYINTYDNSPFYYRNWTSNSINLTPYIGSNVKISFVAAGCVLGAHPGYAYVDAICGPLQINVSNASPCVGSTVVFSAPSVQGGTYSWSGTGVTGLSTQTVNVTASGTYTCVITPSQGAACSYSVTRTISFTPLPVANAGPTQSLTCANTTTVLSGSGGGTYSWSGPGIVSGGTTANPTVNSTGTYTLTVTSGGCTSTPATVAVGQNTAQPLAVASTTGAVTCASNTITLGASPSAMSYTWTAPGGSSITGGVNSQNTTGSGIGVYTVTVKDPANGCSKTATVAALINTVAPSPTVTTTGTVTCLSTGISLSANPSGMTYTWTAPAGSSISGSPNVQNPIGSGAGTYSVVIKDPANGCSALGTVAANVNTVQPGPASVAPNGSITCASSTITMAGTPTTGVTYSWAGPGIVSGGATANPVVNATGNYTMTITSSANGCTNTAVGAAPINTTAPVPVTSSGGTITCGSTAITLSVTPAGMSYTWSPPSGGSITSGTNSQFATGTGAGTYSVIVKSGVNGCSATGTVAPATNTTPITPTISPTPSITCTNTLVTLTGNPSAGVTYSWTGTGIVGASNQQTVNVNQVGNYTLTAINSVNSCTSSVSAAVGNFTVPPTSNAGSTQTITCATPSVQLIGSANPSSCTVVWTGVCAGINSYTATACASGVYTMTATNPANGCSNSSTVQVVPNSGVPSVTIANSGTITCAVLNVNITTTTTASPVTYNWSGPGIVGATNGSSVTVNQGGVYTVTVTNTLNGCSSTITNSITANNAPITPTASASNTITCSTTTITMTAGAGAGSYSYNWSGPGIVGTNTLSTATASLGGNYTATLTNLSSGCSGTVGLTVISNTTAPTSVSISPSTFTLPCTPPTATLTASATGAATYSWIPPSGGSITSGTTSATAGISGPGVYSVIATAANGCSAAPAIATISQSTLAPTFTLSNSSPSITCLSASPTVSIAVTSTVPISSYSWTPTSGMAGATNTSIATFTAAGNYTAVITATNGCTSNAIISVADATTAPAFVAGTATAQAISCATPVVTISPTYTPSTANLTYTWSGPGIMGSSNSQSVTVNQSGLYSLVITNTLTGCTSGTLAIPISGSSVPPTVTVTSSSTIGIGCTPTTSTVTLTASATPTNVLYNWSTSATTPTVATSTPGTYTVTVTDAVTGCSVSATYAVANNTTVPTVNAGANGALPCGAGATYTLNGSSTTAGVTYTWSGSGIVSGANTPSPAVNAVGVYTLTVANPTTGCTASSTVAVASSTVLANFTSDVTSGVSPLTINLTNTSVGAISYSWDFGNGSTDTQTNTAVTYNGSGTYTIVLTASSGLCSDTASTIITVSDGLTLQIPNVFTPNEDGVNDVFTITSTGVKEITLQIFNRWGQKMYEFTGAKAGWDGMTNNGQKASDGTYFYFVKVKSYDDKEISQNGSLSLFR